MYEEGSHEFAQDDTKAVEWYRRAAEQGNADAQYALGAMYEAGRGSRQRTLFGPPYVDAAEWYQKAAEQGNADAQYALGDMYEAGRGVGQDGALAAMWHLKAAKQDNADASFWEKMPGREPLGRCPRCDLGQVFEGNSQYRCEEYTAWDRQCRFKAHKVILGQTLGREEMAKLLAEGSTDLLKDFVVPRSGRRFAACLVLNDDGRVTFKFPPREK